MRTTNDKAMKPQQIYPLIALLALTGCVSATTELSESHPAHPQAEGSPEPIAIPTLMAGSQGLVLPLSTNQTEMQHGQHQQPSAGKDSQQSTERKHEHEHKKEGKK